MSDKIFLLDECVFSSVKTVFKKLGLKTVEIVNLKMQGATDQEVINKAKELKAVLATIDLGFANILRYPPQKYEGIIVLKTKPDPDYINSMLEVLSFLLKRETNFKGKLFIVDDKKYRKRSTV